MVSVWLGLSEVTSAVLTVLGLQDWEFWKKKNFFNFATRQAENVVLPSVVDQSALQDTTGAQYFLSGGKSVSFKTHYVTALRSSSSPFHRFYSSPPLLFVIILHFSQGRANLLPSPARNFRIFQVFLVLFFKCPSFSTKQKYALNFNSFLLKCKSQFPGKNCLLFQCCFCHGNSGFNSACTTCIIYTHTDEFRQPKVLFFFKHEETYVNFLQVQKAPVYFS